MVASQGSQAAGLVVEAAGLVADEVWFFVSKLPPLEQETIGIPMARRADSIGASLAEVYGYEGEAERVRCLFAARAGVFETKYWLNRCRHRGLLSQSSAERHAEQLTQLARQINGFLRALRSSVDGAVREAPARYGVAGGLPGRLFDEEALGWLGATAGGPGDR